MIGIRSTDLHCCTECVGNEMRQYLMSLKLSSSSGRDVLLTTVPRPGVLLGIRPVKSFIKLRFKVNSCATVMKLHC